MTAENKKLLLRTLIFPAAVIIFLWLLDLKCRIIPWWFWLIALMLLYWWTKTRYNRKIKEKLVSGK